MRLTRVYVDVELEPGSIIELPGEAAVHLARVLRARSGEEIILFNGDGREYSGCLETIRGARVTAAVGEGTDRNRESPVALTLVQCIPRGDRMDFIVQKATELGVARIVPVVSQRSVVRLDAAQSEAKAAHWRAVMLNACEQCGRNRLAVVDTPAPLVGYLGSLPAAAAGAARLVLEPSATAGMPAVVAATVQIAIGPEGGFADEELEAFDLAGFARMRLGPRILRTETAAIAALTWLQTRLGDMQP